MSPTSTPLESLSRPKKVREIALVCAASEKIIKLHTLRQGYALDGTKVGQGQVDVCAC